MTTVRFSIAPSPTILRTPTTECEICARLMMQPSLKTARSMVAPLILLAGRYRGRVKMGAVMSKKLQRNFIGFEQDEEYIKLAKKRLKQTKVLEDEVVTMTKSRKDLPKVPFGELVEQGIIPPGAVLTDKKEKFKATVSIDGSLKIKDISGSIHQVGARIQGLPSCNGWDFWHVKYKSSSKLLDDIRENYRSKNLHLTLWGYKKYV